MAEIAAAIGISIAVSLASAALAAAITPAQKIDRGGLNDLLTPKSNYGATIPQAWGEIKLSGNLIWSSLKREEKNSKRKGKSLFSPGVKITSYKYFQSFAVEFAYCPHRPAESLQQLYLSGKLVYDATATDPEAIAASTEFASRHMRFYKGDADQQVDPLMLVVPPSQAYDYGLSHYPPDREAALTDLGLPPDLNHLPAYRKKCYLVLENLPLEDYGNQLPIVKANILFNSENTLETIVSDICAQTNVANFDTSLLSSIPVEGFFINSITEAKQVLRTLQQAYFFDIIKPDDTLRFVPYTAERAVIPIPLTDLASRQGGQARPKTFELPHPDPEDLPESVEITFLDKDSLQEQGNVIVRSQVVGSKRKASYDFPIVMTAEEAQKLADDILFQFYLKATKPSTLQLPRKYAYLEVGDRVEISFYSEPPTDSDLKSESQVGVNSTPYTLQITRIAMGANMLLKVETEIVEAANISAISSVPTAISNGGYNPPLTQTKTISSQGATRLEIMDINLLNDNDEDYGLYVSATGGADWRECSIYFSTDDVNYSLVDTLEGKGTIGTLASTLDGTSTQFEINLDSGSVESISDTDYDSGLNYLLVGNEILQFKDVTDNGDTKELSTLQRGLRGTETFITSHNVGERVVLLSGTEAVVKRIPISPSDIGRTRRVGSPDSREMSEQTRYFKAPSPGQTVDSAVTIPVVIEGLALYPYAPINPVATRDNVGNITISWDRRDRRAGDGEYNNLPLSEVNEKWEVEVIAGNNSVARTITANESSVPYQIGDQNADFGSTQSNIHVRIYQISAVVDRGYGLEANLNTTFVESTPIITEFYPASAKTGDVVTVFGSGLSSLNGVSINGIEQDNLAVTGDAEVSFVVADSTTTGRISIATPGGNGMSNNPLIIERSTAIPVINGAIAVTSNLTISEAHFGQLLLIDTTSGDVTITIDETLLTNPEQFTFAIQKMVAANEALIVGNGNNTIEAVTTISQQFQGLRFNYLGSSIWHGF